MAMPVLDLRDLRSSSMALSRAAAHHYGFGMRTEGFVTVRNHDIPPGMIMEAYDLMRAFFRLDVETRMRYHNPVWRGQRGYVPFGIERYNGGEPELKEHFNWGMTSTHPMFSHPLPLDLWPAEVPGFKAFFRELFRRLRGMWIELRRTLAEFVGLSDFFTQSNEIDDSLMRLLRYPPLSELGVTRGLRFGEHWDSGFLTLLLAPNAPGLQLQTEDGWVDMPVDPELMITNGGQMMRRVAPVFKPRKHRGVVVPGQEEVERMAIALFGQPAPCEMLRPIPRLYEEATGAETMPCTIEAWKFLSEDIASHGMVDPSSA